MSTLGKQFLPPEFSFQPTELLHGPPSSNVVYNDNWGSQGSSALPYNLRRLQSPLFYNGDNPVESAQAASRSVVNRLVEDKYTVIPTPTVITKDVAPTTVTTIENDPNDQKPRYRGYKDLRTALNPANVCNQGTARTTPLQTIKMADKANALKHMPEPKANRGSGLMMTDKAYANAPEALKQLIALKQLKRDISNATVKQNVQFHPSEMVNGLPRADRVALRAAKTKDIPAPGAGGKTSTPSMTSSTGRTKLPLYASSSQAILKSNITDGATRLDPTRGTTRLDPARTSTVTITSSDGTENIVPTQSVPDSGNNGANIILVSNAAPESSTDPKTDWGKIGLGLGIVLAAGVGLYMVTK